MTLDFMRWLVRVKHPGRIAEAVEAEWLAKKEQEELEHTRQRLERVSEQLSVVDRRTREQYATIERRSREQA
ncbi:MAG: hypothetical protein V4529_16915 [Gemmatimonadota bacterium]